jgi:methanogenic corrinoid protein MtbC1
MSDEDDIILSELDDEELVQQMFDDLYDGLKEEIEESVNILLERGWQPYNILTDALGRRYDNRWAKISVMAFCSFQKCCKRQTR